jgi:hypothetical protein
MRYMFLIYTPEDKESRLTPQEFGELMKGHMAVTEEAKKKGVYRAGDPLKPTATSTSVRRDNNGKPLITDGPFAETKEQLGGYYILDCKDLDEAIEWAKKIPTYCGGNTYGCIEVRPIQDVAELAQMIQANIAAQHV